MKYFPYLAAIFCDTLLLSILQLSCDNTVMSSTNGSRKRPASAQQHEFTSQKSQRIDIGQSPDDGKQKDVPCQHLISQRQGFVTASDQAARIPKQHSTKWNTGQRARHKHRPGKPQVSHDITLHKVKSKLILTRSRPL